MANPLSEIIKELKKKLKEKERWPEKKYFITAIRSLGKINKDLRQKYKDLEEDIKQLQEEYVELEEEIKSKLENVEYFCEDCEIYSLPACLNCPLRPLLDEIEEEQRELIPFYTGDKKWQKSKK